MNGQAELLVPLTFIVIIGTVVLQSITSRFIALRLGVGEPEAKGILIVGANALAREIAKALRECGFMVLLADTGLDQIRAARMEGFETYYGNIVSEHADQHLDLIGIGCLLALSERQEINQLACRRYRSEFRRRAVFSIQTENHVSLGARSRFALSPEGRTLFGAHADIHKLHEMLKEGAKIHKTVLTGQHGFQCHLQMHQENAVPLFTISPKGTIEFFAVDREILPKPGWTLVSLVSSATAPDNTAPS